MKTTVELADELVERARQVIKGEGTTLRALIEEGLQRAITARAAVVEAPFEMKTFGRGGLRPEFEGAGWERVRDEIYRGRA